MYFATPAEVQVTHVVQYGAPKHIRIDHNTRMVALNKLPHHRGGLAAEDMLHRHSQLGHGLPTESGTALKTLLSAFSQMLSNYTMTPRHV